MNEEMRMHKRPVLWTSAIALTTLLTACGGPSAQPEGGSGSSAGRELAEGERYQVALNLSYTGNAWQDAAANLIKATAATAPYDDMVDLRVDIAGPDVTAQTQLINQQVAAGVDAIIIYPISPTALNSAVRQACDAGIVVHAYDSIISEPCAYNAFIDQYEWGRVTAEWLVDELGGEGNIAVVTGVAGTTVDTLRNQALDDVLAENPGIKVVGSENGMWDQAQGRTAYQRIEAAAPDIDGVWAQAGCYSIVQYVVSTGKPPVPCAGEGANGDRLNMLPESEGGLSAPGISASSTVYPGEVAFLNVMRLLQGEEVSPVTLLPVTPVTSEDLVLGTNPAEGANVFPADLVPPDFFAEIWSPLVGQGIQGALTGESDSISEPKPCSEVEGCTETTLEELDYDFSG
jgi:ribose transport system substrate-binding protein